MSRYRQFDRDSLLIRPLDERVHDLSLDIMIPLDVPNPLPNEEGLRKTALRLISAQKQKRSIIMGMGAHVIRAGTTPHLVDLMERGYLTHIACNGAGAIHDFELALIGQTCESVPKYISSGEFGLWRETSRLNDIITRAAKDGLGLGEAVGKEIWEGDYPNKKYSLFAQAYRLGVPVTVHVGIGYDIIYEHANCDGAAWGETSYRDFLIFAHSVTTLEGGAYLSFGSAVMGPEVYLKALAMARNVAHRRGEKICHFTTLACDLIPIQGDFRQQAPKSDPQYYYRPYKTILVRTVADGGESFYVCGDHKHTVPSLRRFVLEQAEQTG